MSRISPGVPLRLSRVISLVLLSCFHFSVAPGSALSDQHELSSLKAPPTLRESISRLIESGKLPEAQAALKAAGTGQGDTLDILYLQALLLFKEQQYEPSLKKAQECLTHQPHDAEAQWLVARNAIVLNKLDLAESALKTLVQLSPNDYLVHMHTGLLFYSTNRFALAKDEFQEAVRLNPRFMKGYDLLALSQEEVESTEAVLNSYRKAIQLAEEQHLQDEAPYLHLAKFLWQKNRGQEALEPAKKAAELNPRSAEAYCVLGKILDRLGQVEPSIAALQKAVQVDPQYAEAHYSLSRVYQKQGKQEEAAREMRIFQEVRKKENSSAF